MLGQVAAREERREGAAEAEDEVEEEREAIDEEVRRERLRALERRRGRPATRRSTNAAPASSVTAVPSARSPLLFVFAGERLGEHEQQRAERDDEKRREGEAEAHGQCPLRLAAAGVAGRRRCGARFERRRSALGRRSRGAGSSVRPSAHDRLVALEERLHRVLRAIEEDRREEADHEDEEHERRERERLAHGEVGQVLVLRVGERAEEHLLHDASM